MKILVIGHDSNGRGFHFGEGIHEAFRKLGYDSTFYSVEEILKPMSEEMWKLHKLRKKPIELSKIINDLNQEFDLVFIDQNDVRIDVNGEITVFSFIKYIHRNPSVSRADVLFFLTNPLLEYCKGIKEAWLCYNAKKLIVMPSCIDPSLYKLQPKTLKGVVGIGDRTKIEVYLTDSEILQEASLELIRREIKEFKNAGFQYIEEPVTDEEYRNVLPKCKATWFPLPRGQYWSRRVLEAMISKTLMFINLHNDKHEKALKDGGLINGVHYVGVDDISEIEQAFTETTNKDEIVENAYKLVLEKHTYANRAKQIIEAFNEL